MDTSNPINMPKALWKQVKLNETVPSSPVSAGMHDPHKVLFPRNSFWSDY